MADLNELVEKLSAIRTSIEEDIKNVSNFKEAFEYRKVLMDSKTGKVGSLMREMGKIPNELKAEYGKRVNELKNWAQGAVDDLEKKFKEAELNLRYEKEAVDVTLPSKKYKTGNLHPNTQVRNQLVDIFGSMGFDIFEGNEIETDYYNFTALNIPADHPARDMQDTFYLSPDFLLRTQTSSGQIHVMEAQKPPYQDHFSR